MVAATSARQASRCRMVRVSRTAELPVELALGIRRDQGLLSSLLQRLRILANRLQYLPRLLSRSSALSWGCCGGGGDSLCGGGEDSVILRWRGVAVWGHLPQGQLQVVFGVEIVGVDPKHLSCMPRPASA